MHACSEKYYKWSTDVIWFIFIFAEKKMLCLMLELGELLACCFRYLHKFYRAATYYMHYKSKVENSVLMILKCLKGLAE